MNSSFRVFFLRSSLACSSPPIHLNPSRVQRGHLRSTNEAYQGVIPKLGSAGNLPGFLSPNHHLADAI